MDVEFSCPKPTNCCVDLAYFSAASTGLLGISTTAGHEFSRHDSGDMVLETVQTHGKKSAPAVTALQCVQTKQRERLKAEKGEKPDPR